MTQNIMPQRFPQIDAITGIARGFTWCAAGSEPMNLLDLDLTMDALAREQSSLAELIEMRYFGGMTAEETAEVVGRSMHVVRHELRLAHAWLRRELGAQS